MILVVGSTGYLGSEICRLLRADEQPVRGLVRTTSAPEKVERLQSLGVQTVVGDLRDPASLAEACRGMESVVTTAATTISRQPGDSILVTDQQGQLDLVQAARAAGVKHFAMVSILMSMGTCPFTTAKRTVEQAVMSSGMEYTILRPGLFMEVWLSPIIGFDYPNTKATVFGEGHSKNSYISLGDVAQYVVESLSHPAAKNTCFDLCQPQAFSMQEVVRIFEKLGEKPFDLTYVPAEALQAQAAAATDALQASTASLMHDIATGHINGDPSQAEHVFGLKLTTMEEYAQRVLETTPVS